MLALFCTAMRRSVINEVGPLDERFGFGMFEDDDYALRMREKGYHLLCAEDVFVHHWGSAGFSFVAFEHYWLTFQENRQKFEDKWGLEWTPPRYRDELLDEQLRGTVKDKTWLANLVIEHTRTINELRSHITMIESSSSYRFTRVLWRVLARLAPRNSPQHRLGRAAAGGLVRTVKNLLPREHQQTVLPTSRPEHRTLAEKQLDELLAENALARDVVVLAPTILWNVPLFQRPQQMALAFARQGCLVIFCEVPGSTDFTPGFHKISERLYVYANAPLDVLNRIPSPAVLALAYNRSTLANFSEPRLVYEYIDELNVLPGDTVELQRNHDALVKDASVIVATADVLFQRLRMARPDAILSPNAVDAEFISSVIRETHSPPEDIAELVKRGPIIGYYGAMARWFNFNLWIEAARARPNYQFLLIGPDYDGGVQELQSTHLENIHWLGPRPYRELPRYLKYFNVATIPFRLNEITHSTSPIKLFEYLVAEKPVVTTAMRECKNYPVVLIGRNEVDFIAKLDQALELQYDDSYKRLLQQTALENTWDRRALQILQALEAHSSHS
jgi:glycosyltransferase involved in cell wall biosynthesis